MIKHRRKQALFPATLVFHNKLPNNLQYNYITFNFQQQADQIQNHA